jgi:PAS domain-containing protein
MPSTILPRARQPGSANLPADPYAPGLANDELGSLFELSLQPLLLWDDSGAITRANGPARELIGSAASQMSALSPALALLLGWPADLPVAGRTVEQDDWITGPDGRSVHLRARVRGVLAGPDRFPGAA